MKKIQTQAGVIALSAALLAGSYIGFSLAKDSSDYELKTTSITDILEDEDIQNITTLDEELAEENIDIISKDEEFRKNIMYLEYYKSSGEEDLYNETLNWLRDHFKSTSEELLLGSVKGAIADEEDISISDITLEPAPDYNEDTLFLTPKATAGIEKDYHEEGYTIKAKALNEAVNLCANIQSMNFNEASAKDIVKLYDEVTEKSKMAIASGASRHDNEINEKNSKKYIKKNYKI
jgi:hypothetical protein